MDDYILITTLNDFVFCPYSVYLHNVYAESDESIYHAIPQVRGKIAHNTIDSGVYSSKKAEITSLNVCSEQLKVMGKIDLYKQDKKMLVERKFAMKQIFKGQIYQLWAQYFCMIEMGYEVEKLAFYIMSTNTMMPIDIPGERQFKELEAFIGEFRSFSLKQPFAINRNKCLHCIYCNLCDKMDIENVYT